MSIKKKIQNLISNNQIKKALDELEQFSSYYRDEFLINQVILLKSRFNEVEKEYHFGGMTYYDSSNTKTKIINALLYLVDNISDEKTMKKRKVEKVFEFKILFLASNPFKTPQLQLEKEFIEISRSLQEGRISSLLHSEWAITPKDLQIAIIKHKPTIIHFSGHGKPENKELLELSKKIGIEIESGGGLILQNIKGENHIVSTRAISNLFDIVTRKIDIKVVLLNCCYSEEQAKAISMFVPYVIGTNNSVGDKAAIKFSSGFYRGISHGEDIEYSFELALNMIKLENLKEDDIHVLYGK